jgi:2-oxo-4-hydroxy-4-carboxy--5-ureidoimidazoline (OHCU) decarboxylase
LLRVSLRTSTTLFGLFAAMALEPASSLQSLPDDTVEKILGLLFEPSPALTALLLPEIRSALISSYIDLATLARRTLSSLPTDSPLLHSILSAHPRLGAKRVDSTHSQSEQKSLGNEIERAQLQKLNEEYEARFPGLRYVVFVNGRSREEVMADMRTRIASGTMEGEVKLASDAMCDIAVDRARKMGAE